MLPIDVAAHTGKWRHRHPLDKAILASGLLVAAIVMPPWPGSVLAGTAAVAVMLGPARVRPRLVWRVARAPVGFAVTGALTLLVTVGGDGGVFGIAGDGPERAGTLLAHTTAAGLAALLFALTTPLSDVLPRLVRVGVPVAVVDVAAVMYRMTFLLLDTVTNVSHAQAGRLGHRTRRARWRSAAGLGATVFIQAFDRAQRLHEGLAGRGYDGRLRVLVDGDRVSRSFVAASLTLVAAIVAAAHFLTPVLT